MATAKAFPIKALRAPFPESAIRTKLERDGQPRRDERGNPIPYLEARTVTERLNEAFGGRWCFEIVKHQIGRDQVWVLGRLSACGVTKEQFGSAEIKRRLEIREVIDIGNDLKSAASDALKKCASLMGVGLYLQDKDARSRAEGAGANGSHANGSPGKGEAWGDIPVTEEQAREFWSKALDAGWDRERILDSVERLTGARELRALLESQLDALLQEIGEPGED
ncbi:MAG: hypothetical protein HYZ11_00550 [Candidatus Tectomicrobia bacterium]|uniref:Uncharacterized protein n=1 Tax=Tectimicrobiota bacterium TaxID=2528274 RepID=A0A932HX73_UNCTE|nr:hypothetical protein [Candidatus Tectomicrobia bacterium]